MKEHFSILMQQEITSCISTRKECFPELPDYNFKCGASAAFRADNNLLIKVQIIDSVVGNMYISLSYIDDYVTVMMRKLEESYFTEYDGVFSGKLSI